jgi:hypothetical protein
MGAQHLEQAYVKLDRSIFLELKDSSDLRELFSGAEKRLEERHALGNFQTLCAAGAEPEQVLWILSGLEGLPELRNTFELFGWPAKELAKHLESIELTASLIEKTRSYPFGMLVQASLLLSAQQLPEDLRAYASMARAAQGSFGHNAQWFLNIAKARLVQHVTHRTVGGQPHDKEVSGLIAAMTGSDSYDEGSQKRWRHKHKGLVGNNWLDPYLTWSSEDRENAIRQHKELCSQYPEVRECFKKLVFMFVTLIQRRSSRLPQGNS